MDRMAVRRAVALAVLATVMGACGGDSTTTPGSIALSLSSWTAAVTQGQSATVSVTVARTNFTGDVSLSADGLPSGVTASFSPATLGANATSSTLTLAAAAGAAVGTSTVTVHANGTGITSRTATIALTVTSSGAFTIALDPTTLSMEQGTSATATITVARTGTMGGAVALTASGLPAGVTASFEPASIAAGSTTSTLTLTAAANATAGTANVSVNGTSAGFPDQTGTIALTVTQAPPSTELSLGFCPDEAPIWAAYQTTGGTWTRATITNTAVTVRSSGDKVAIAMVFRDTSAGATDHAETEVAYLTADDVAAINAAGCATNGTKTLAFSVAGLASGQTASVNAGYSSASVPTNSSFQLTSLPEGPLDVVALRNVGSVGEFTPDLAIVRRGLDLADGATVDPLDFSASEAVALDSALVTVSGLNGETGMVNLSLTTANGTDASFAWGLLAGDTMTVHGLPAAATIASDLYGYTVFTSTRGVFSYGSTFGDATLELGPAISQPTVTAAATAPYVRLRFQVPFQSEYGYGISAQADQSTTGRDVWILVTTGYAGTTDSWDVSIPDLTGVDGWDDSWGMQTGETVTWGITAMGGSRSLFWDAAPSAGDVARVAFAQSDTAGIAVNRVGSTPSLRAARGAAPREASRSRTTGARTIPELRQFLPRLVRSHTRHRMR